MYNIKEENKDKKLTENMIGKNCMKSRCLLAQDLKLLNHTSKKKYLQAKKKKKKPGSSCVRKHTFDIAIFIIPRKGYKKLKGM